MTLLLALSLLGTNAPTLGAQVRLEFTEVHMAMPLRIVVYAEDRAQARQAVRAAFRRVVKLEDILSHFRPQSELRRLEAAPAREWVEVSPELFGVLVRGLEVARATEGGFDPTVGPLVELWRGARASGRLPDVEAIESARARTGWCHMELDRARNTVRLAKSGMRLDLGGVAKGYILESALSVLTEHGFPRALVEAGGDVVVGEAPPGRPGWHVEVGASGSALAERASGLTHAALATSGAEAQYMEVDGTRYSHVIDPRTGLGVTTPYVAHVIAGDAGTADALATALTVLGPEGVAAIRERFPGVMASVHPPVGVSGISR